jgi:hypothetical protein
VDGKHFDLLAEDFVFEYIITVPGYPRRVEGRQAVAELYRPYGAPPRAGNARRTRSRLGTTWPR